MYIYIHIWANTRNETDYQFASPSAAYGPDVSFVALRATHAAKGLNQPADKADNYRRTSLR